MAALKPVIHISGPGMYPRRRSPKVPKVPDLKITNGVPVKSKQDINVNDGESKDFDDLILSKMHAVNDESPGTFRSDPGLPKSPSFHSSSAKSASKVSPRTFRNSVPNIPPGTARSEEVAMVSSNLSKQLSHSTSSLIPKAVHHKSVHIEFERTGSYQDVGRPSMKGSMRRGKSPVVQRDPPVQKSENVSDSLPLILTSNMVSQNGVLHDDRPMESDRVPFVHPKHTPRKDGKLEWADVKNNTHIRNRYKERNRSGTTEKPSQDMNNDLEEKLTNLTNEVNTMKQRVDKLERQGSLLSLLSNKSSQQTADRYDFKHLFKSMNTDQVESKDFFALYSYTLRKKPFSQSSTFLVPQESTEPPFSPDRKHLKVKGEHCTGDKSVSKQKKKNLKIPKSMKGQSITRKYQEHIENSKTPGELALLLGKENNRPSRRDKFKSEEDPHQLENQGTNRSSHASSGSTKKSSQLPYIPMQEITFSASGGRSEIVDDDSFFANRNRRQPNTINKRTTKKHTIAGDLGLQFHVVKLPQIPKLADRKFVIMSDRVKAHYASLEEFRRSSFAPDAPPGTPISFGYHRANILARSSPDSSFFKHNSPDSSLSRYSSLSSDSDLQRLSEQLQPTKPKRENLHINLAEILKTASDSSSSIGSCVSADHEADNEENQISESYGYTENLKHYTEQTKRVDTDDNIYRTDHELDNKGKFSLGKPLASSSTKRMHSHSNTSGYSNNLMNISSKRIHELRSRTDNLNSLSDVTEEITNASDNGHIDHKQPKSNRVTDDALLNIVQDANQNYYGLHGNNIKSYSADDTNISPKSVNKGKRHTQMSKDYLSLPETGELSKMKFDSLRQLENENDPGYDTPNHDSTDCSIVIDDSFINENVNSDLIKSEHNLQGVAYDADNDLVVSNSDVPIVKKIGDAKNENCIANAGDSASYIRQRTDMLTDDGNNITVCAVDLNKDRDSFVEGAGHLDKGCDNDVDDATHLNVVCDNFEDGAVALNEGCESFIEGAADLNIGFDISYKEANGCDKSSDTFDTGCDVQSNPESQGSNLNDTIPEKSKFARAKSFYLTES